MAGHWAGPYDEAESPYIIGKALVMPLYGVEACEEVTCFFSHSGASYCNDTQMLVSECDHIVKHVTKAPLLDLCTETTSL